MPKHTHSKKKLKLLYKKINVNNHHPLSIAKPNESLAIKCEY